MRRIGVVIPAGGSGLRMGGQLKPFLLLAGKSVLERAVAPFLERKDVVAIVIVLPATETSTAVTDPRVRIVAGGRERSDSVRAGLDALGDSVDLVVIHDAARPLVSREVIDRVIAAAVDGGAIAALPASDTIHEVDADAIVRTPDRARLWQAQTPQAFPRALITNAHLRALEDGIPATDDAALVVRYGGTVRVVPGDPVNLKLTRPEDLPAAEALLRARGQ